MAVGQVVGVDAGYGSIILPKELGGVVMIIIVAKNSSKNKNSNNSSNRNNSNILAIVGK